MTRLVHPAAAALFAAALVGGLPAAAEEGPENGAAEGQPWGPPPPDAPVAGSEEAPLEPVAPPPETPAEPAPPATEPPPEVHVDPDVPAGETAPEAVPAAGAEAAPTGEAGPEAEEGTYPVRVGGLTLEPFLILVGGAAYHHIVPREDVEGVVDERQGRFWTPAMTRFGFLGSIGEHVALRSELELNGGPHGTSVWEGQGAMSILDQYIRLTFGSFRLDAGRISDPRSIDYFSSHVANLMLTDDWVRTPFLYSGANRGNGVLASYEVVPGLTIGFTVNAGNPLSNTASASFGGTYGIFARFYTQAQASVADSPTAFPDDKFYVLLVSPSISYEWTYLRAQLAMQYMMVDVSMSDGDNPTAEGINFRGGLQGLIWDGRIRPFLNFSHITNHTFDADGSTPIIDALSQSVFEGMTVGAGLDVDFLGPTGVGLQYNWVSEQVGDYGPITTRHYFNLGASWWFLPSVCVEARYAFYLQCQDEGEGPQCGAQHHHNVFLTLRGVFGLDRTRRVAQTL